MLGGDDLGGFGGASEVQRGRNRRPAHRRAFHVEVAALEVVGRATQRATQDRQELVRPVVALVMVQPVAEAPLLAVVAARHDVEQKPPVGDALVRGCLLGGERRRQRVRPERDEELETLRLTQQRCCDEPGVLAPGARRREDSGEAEVVGGVGDLGEVVDRRVATMTVLTERDDRPAVTGGREEPVQHDAHVVSSNLGSTGGGDGVDRSAARSTRRRRRRTARPGCRDGRGGRRERRPAVASTRGRSSRCVGHDC